MTIMTVLNAPLQASKTTKARAIVYWTTLVILEFALLSGGAAYLLRAGYAVEGIQQLGYPLYFVSILGFWKIMGGIALLVPRFPRLQEWAYAGIFFDLTGGAVSHIAVGNSAWHVLTTLIFATILLINWATRKNVSTIWKRN
jgi:hypothetical protein